MQTNMPDIADTAPALQTGKLDWVGMGEIELPFIFESRDLAPVTVNAKARAFVNLHKEEAKGIHMSRLFLALDMLSTEQQVNPQTIAQALDTFITSHEGLSDKAQIEFKFELPLRRKSLLSGKTGWKSYPITLTSTLENNNIHYELTVDVTYSSTCPCSAALARQLIQNAFSEKFNQETLSQKDVHEWLGTTQGIVATPHSQRSIANVKVKLNSKTDEFDVVNLINMLEEELKTPVQAAVKREDEQEFARLNGQNLMFCEDAARKIKALLEHNNYADYWLQINHYESLHAHDAVAIAVKGLTNGYQA
ncbi:MULTISPECIES: GTP cyclohydrolase FolE2 [Pseudoalteromonas]|uniref:GTP cyclohydrolase FolE2 n=1 Tax=Pseudoalteromonas fuliginea TaxID=1872678 RepID=A0ABD3YAA7_9GAMM|nr:MULTISPECIES: GTP cyclohydrolase FolE2 [Pseudoalteromonas]ATG78537.1 GTP cyclohydrolase [Pseudoalteromonas sp. 1_2015MBL_MicDiv]KDC51453.1 GTP cyclohydrolase [Pseudoalteromonas fuliginea]KDC54099.1 GTP cyclohydrolase [Pseudoalteromonas sp. S3431]KJZ27377.1 GTP cyclohydrolase [Pseudoalteromonas fuliginea]MDQ2045359.1 GTP cyclohydrolase FolE2 [Pseudoalteromonas sp. 20-92]